MSLFRKIILLCGDIGTLYLALLMTLAIRYQGVALPQTFAVHLVPFSFTFCAWILIFYLADFYRARSFRTPRLLVQKLSIIIGIALLTSTILFYLFSSFFELTPKTNLFIFGVVFFILEYLWRFIALHLFATGASPILILGDSPRIEETVAHLKDHPHLGYAVAEWIQDPLTLTQEKLTTIITEKKISFIIVQSTLTNNFSTLHILYESLIHDITIIHFLEFYELIFEKIPLQEINEEWCIENITSYHKIYDITKRALDSILSIFLICLFSPFFILIPLLIWSTSRGPAFYVQKRIGKNRKIFSLFKFRTMHNNAGGALWTEQNDARITGIGKILRATHLDELPQLFNIVKGDIAFVGPRPERSELAQEYAQFPYYHLRHLVKPGLTGWAQINYKPSASLEEAYEKLQYDIFYIKNKSWILDSMIILKTIRHFFS